MAQRDLRRVKRAAERVEAARDELARAIVAAVESGETLRDIAPYAGIAHSRLHEIVRRERERGKD